MNLPACFLHSKAWLNNPESFEDAIRAEVNSFLKAQRTFSKGWPARLTKEHCMARFGDSNISYSFKGVQKPVHAWPPILNQLRELIEAEFNWRANCVVVNTYQPAGDLYPHRDSTYIPELGVNPTIVSISFGATRTFLIFETDKKGKRIEPGIGIELAPGDLFVMRDEADSKYMHGIRPETEAIGERLSLTFRKHNV